jgi:hypothetical protein
MRRDWPKAKLLDQQLSLLDTDLVISTYAGTVDEIIELDSKDGAGLISKYAEVLKIANVKVLIASVRRSGNLDEYTHSSAQQWTSRWCARSVLRLEGRFLAPVREQLENVCDLLESL